MRGHKAKPCECCGFSAKLCTCVARRLDGQPRRPIERLQGLTADQKAQRHRYRQNAQNAERRALGLCTWCGLPAAPFAQCAEHRAAVMRTKLRREEREERALAKFLGRLELQNMQKAAE